MAYTIPTPSTVSAGDTFPASAYNIISADIQDHETRIKTGVESYTTVQKNALAGVAAGTVAYDSNLAALQMYTGSAWVGVIPSGVINEYAGSTAPAGWLLCDGSTLNSVTNTQYAPLFAAIGTNYGGSGASSFILPDLQGRIPVGKGSHSDVATLGLNDGAALASRRPKHLHTASSSASSTATVSETSTGAQSYDYSINQYAAGSGSSFKVKCDSQAGGYGGGGLGTAYAHTHSVGVSVSTTVTPIVGPQTLAPTDAPSYLVVNYIIKI